MAVAAGVVVAGGLAPAAAGTAASPLAVTRTDRADVAAAALANATADAGVADAGNASAEVAAALELPASGAGAGGSGTEAKSKRGLSFDYHKPAFPLDWHHDGLTIAFATVGLMIAASGGIGGGGILVPLFMLVLGFRPKHAIALSNFTILGGAIANTALNARKRHPELTERPLIDWDLILIMEPLTIFGAVFGSLLSKILPNVVLTVSLVAVLAFMGQRTLKKGFKMWAEESRRAPAGAAGSQVEMLAPVGSNGSNGSPGAGESRMLSLKASGPESPSTTDDVGGSDLSYLELQSDADSPASHDETSLSCKIAALTLCFVGACVLTVLKGGGNLESPLGFECGSRGFWLLYFAAMPWVLIFAAAFRLLLVGEFERKVRRGHVFARGEVQWDSSNTLKYPVYCAVAGLLAGLFGVGGGIVKGPLMLEMGVIPSVASASAAAMILFTSAAASTSFVVFGLLHAAYGALFFLLGLVSTAVGQYGVSRLVERHQRQSPIVLSIGFVITLSSLLVAVNTVASLLGPAAGDFFRPHGVCSAEA